MSKIEFLSLEIECPIYWQKQEIEYRYTYTSDGQIIFSPFNGCDNMNGCESCNECLRRENAFITSLPSLEDVLKRYGAR